MNSSPHHTRTALVVGGSRGIGAGIAQRLAREGANVALTYASAQARAGEVAAAIEAQGRQALALQADSGNPDDLQWAVKQTVERSAASTSSSSMPASCTLPTWPNSASTSSIACWM